MVARGVRFSVHLVRFVAVGVLNTGFGYAIYFGLVRLGMMVELALFLATVLGVTFNFFTTGRFVFDNADNRLFGRFAAAYVGIYVINAAILRLTITFGADAVLAQAYILPFTTLGTFIIMRLFVFRQTEQDGAATNSLPAPPQSPELDSRIT